MVYFENEWRVGRRMARAGGGIEKRRYPVGRAIGGKVKILATVLAVAFFGFGCSPGGTEASSASRGVSPGQDRGHAVDAQTRAEVIDGALAALRGMYVFPDVAEKMAQEIEARERRGEYSGLRSGSAFAARLTKDLRRVSHDKHLQIHYWPGGQRPEHPKLVNHGLSRVERLPGNVGLIAIRAFARPDTAVKEALAEAMKTVHGTDALIFDLRRNQGGAPHMVVVVCSYLFGPERVELSEFYGRDGELVEDFHTKKKLQGPRYLDEDVYILTSVKTVSGGEAFAHDLKHIGRDTVIGETTAGAANPAKPVPLPAKFAISVPFAQPVSPITGTNWEGTGVKPHIAVPAGDALKTALREARKPSARE